MHVLYALIHLHKCRWRGTLRLRKGWSKTQWLSITHVALLSLSMSVDFLKSQQKIFLQYIYIYIYIYMPDKVIIAKFAGIGTGPIGKLKAS